MYVLAKDKHNEKTDTSDLFAIFLTIEDGSDIKQLLSFVKLTGTTSKLILNFVLLSAFLSTSCCCSIQISSPTLLQRVVYTSAKSVACNYGSKWVNKIIKRNEKIIIRKVIMIITR